MRSRAFVLQTILRRYYTMRYLLERAEQLLRL